MKLSGMHERGTREEHLRAIKGNVELVISQFRCSEEQVVADNLELTEYAASIEDEGERVAFMSLIGTWSRVADVQLETCRALKCVVDQLESLVSRVEP